MKKVKIKNEDGIEELLADDVRYHRSHCIVIKGSTHTLYNRRKVSVYDVPDDAPEARNER